MTTTNVRKKTHRAQPIDSSASGMRARGFHDRCFIVRNERERPATWSGYHHP